jgi:O-methyltransferase
VTSLIADQTKNKIIATDYIALLKKVLLNAIYDGTERTTMLSRSPWYRKLVNRVFRRLGFRLTEPADLSLLLEGRCWPVWAHTMIGLKRLDNIQFCVEQIIGDRIEGDLIETGVWRGGACILMRGILKAYGITNKIVWVADSFEGLPKPTNRIDKSDPVGNHYRDSELAVSLEQVKANFSAYGLLDDQVHFLKGWFRDTLPGAPLGKLALMRLDGDLYESTMDALVNLYPKLSIGGYAIVDDYNNIPACKKAVGDYREKFGIHENIINVDWTAAYWRREH